VLVVLLEHFNVVVGQSWNAVDILHLVIGPCRQAKVMCQGECMIATSFIQWARNIPFDAILPDIEIKTEKGIRVNVDTSH